NMSLINIFAKDIDRPIQGVIKVGQAKEENIKQELEEYVVTRELQQHFNKLFTNYQSSINNPTDKMGVWIQGFFGSGKSHFLKIVSYLLANKEVGGKPALQYFKEDNKIHDPLTIAAMERVTQIKTDVILFNIDSKSDAGGKKDKNGIVNVFLKVFNEYQGYSTIPYLADFERRLVKEEQYDAFKSAFKQINGNNWEDERHEFDWITDDIKEAVIQIGFLSEEAITNVLEKAAREFSISIEDFAKRVKEYLKTKGSDHHIAFMVDEVGQYIGGNRDLTLQLQTVVEDLGRECEGRAWVLVTSQEAIDHVTTFVNNSENDFSKIKDRFGTTISLSSANADEVIKERILKKKKVASDSLEADYAEYESDLKNKFRFEKSPEKPFFENANDFATIYPFIPYQFNLLADILTEIRKHSHQGSNLSSGERSLLALFKEAAENNKEKDTTSLVSLDQFFLPMERWMDTAIQRVIARAKDDPIILSPTDEDEFNVNVLRVLFLIKYVGNEVKPNIDNIAILMTRNVKENRLEIKKRIEKALELLIKQNYVRKNLDNYIFLTDEEQEITREINNQSITDSQLIAELSKRIFDGVIDGNTFSYEKLGKVGGRKFKNRYVFSYIPVMDNLQYKQVNNAEMTVNFISPYSDLSGQEAEIAVKSSRNHLYIVIPPEKTLMEDLSAYVKLNNYLNTQTSTILNSNKQVRSEKQEELSDLSIELKKEIDDVLKEVKFFFNGNEIVLSGNDFKMKLQTGLQNMASEVYHKLSYIDSPKEDADIMATIKNQDSLLVDLSNQLAVDEVLRFIAQKDREKITITLKTIRDQFEKKQPFGFVDLDIEWIIAHLFMSAKIDLLINNVNISRMADSREILSVVQKRRDAEKVKIIPAVIISAKLKKIVDQVGKELFNNLSLVDDNNNEQTMKDFKSAVSSHINKLNEYFSNKAYRYPGNYLYTSNKRYLDAILATKSVEDFFNIVSQNRDILLDWAEDFEKIQSFHKHGSKTKEFWEKAQDNVKKIKESESEISNPALDEVVSKLSKILNMQDPYDEVKKLNELNAKFDEIYLELLEARSNNILKLADGEKKVILELLTGKVYENKYLEEV
ncbi:MAG: BREX system P-loop protein BrxC, partial [Streptococcaceae bacterium]|nr:BREX system P-loop protein BrxC [Streptococcaceae bacterium]